MDSCEAVAELSCKRDARQTTQLQKEKDVRKISAIVLLSICYHFFSICLVLYIWTPSQASPGQLKIYRKIYPGLKPAYTYCHLDEKPQKDKGKHELNPYGSKLKELMGEKALAEGMIKLAGRHDEFKAKEGEKTGVAIEKSNSIKKERA